MKRDMSYREFCLFGVRFLMISALLILWNTPVYGEETRGVSDDTIKIGAINDMTGPFAADTGPEGYVGGIRLYFKHVNEKGGIHGRKVKIIAEDSRYTIPLSVAAFKKLVFRDKVLAILGYTGTGQTKALWSQIEKEKIPSFTVSLAEANVKPLQRYLFIPAATYEDEIRILAKYIIEDLKAKNARIGIVTMQLEYGKVAIAALNERAKNYNIQPPAVEFIEPGAIDATSQVLTLKKAKTDYVILHLGIAPTAAVVRSAMKFKFSPTFFGTFYSCDEEIIRLGGKAAEGYIGIHSFNPWYYRSSGMDQLRNITLKYQPGKSRNRCYLQGWVTSMILAEAMKKAGKALTNESLIDAVESLRDYSTGDICAPITYSTTSHKASEYCRLYVADVKNVQFKPLTGWIKP
ncbi:MAG: ABC transporter substrate-binding protein [Thermodesulfobacteriota bacterium]|nr:ABC transporter substrate-binding protein [Thermodesulfobacteriota bacterium]